MAQMAEQQTTEKVVIDSINDLFDMHRDDFINYHIVQLTIDLSAYSLHNYNDTKRMKLVLQHLQKILGC